MAIFNQTRATKNIQATAVTIIATGNRFVGDIDVSGQLQVDGTMDGSICAKNTMTIGAKGEMRGSVKGQKVQIAGCFEGEMWCEDLTIYPGGLVSGKVHCRRLTIEPGGSFLGQRDDLVAQTDNDYAELESTGVLLESSDL